MRRGEQQVEIETSKKDISSYYQIFGPVDNGSNREKTNSFHIGDDLGYEIELI